MADISPSRRSFLRNALGMLVVSSTAPLTVIGRVFPEIHTSESGALVVSYVLKVSDFIELEDVSGSVKLTAPEQLLLNPDHVRYGRANKPYPIAVTRVAETGTNAFVAVSTYCTHGAGYQIRDFNPDTEVFVCPHQGSTFKADGTHVVRPNTPNVGNLRKFAAVYDEGAGTVTLEGVLAVADVEEAPETPTALFLDQNHPNPFRHSTLIRFGLPQASHVRLQVFSLEGTLLTTIMDEERPAGTHIADFSARGLAEGTYFYRLETGTGTLMRRLVLVR